MSVMNHENANLFNCLIDRLKVEMSVLALSGAYTLTDAHASVLNIDPNGAARNVTLPATSRANRGRIFIIYNSADAAENLVLKQSDGSTTVITIAQNKIGIVWNDGTGSTTASWVGGLGA